MLDVDQGLLRHSGREWDVGGTTDPQPQIELVWEVNGAGIFALTAAGAGIHIHIAGLLQHFYGETARSALVGLHLAVGEHCDVFMVSRGCHPWCGDTGGTVQGGEDLTQHDHLPADAWILLYEGNGVSLVPKVYGRLQASNAAANHDDIKA